MFSQLLTLVTTSLVVVAITTKPEFSGLPSCAIAFLTAVSHPLHSSKHHTNTPKAKDAQSSSSGTYCALTDTTCFCSNSKLVAAFEASIMANCNAGDQAQANSAMRILCPNLFSPQQAIPPPTTVFPPQTSSTATPFSTTTITAPNASTTTITTTLQATAASSRTTSATSQTEFNLDTYTPTFPTLSVPANTTMTTQASNTATSSTQNTTTSRVNSGVEGEVLVVGKLIWAMVLGMGVMTFAFAEL
jgi:hypothetical protein